MMKGLERVRRARSQLVLDKRAIFYACLALELGLEASTTEETMAVSPKMLFVNEAFADSLTDGKLRGVLVHEIEHIARGHHVRRGNRDPLEWNEACDYVINPDLIDQGYELPEDCLLDRQYQGMSAEECYAKRRAQKAQQQQKQGKQGQGQPQAQSSQPFGCGKVLDAVPPGKPAELAEEAAKWQAKVFNAAAVASKQAGFIPAHVKLLIEQQRKPPQENWRETLRRFVSESSVKDYSWSRPNRRLLGQGLYLPGLVSDATAHMLGAIDTSGSVCDPKTQQAFADEMTGILNSGACDKLTVIYCDTKLAGETEFERGEEMKIEPHGGGGTSFAPVMEWTLDKNAVCLIYFTDLYCSDYGDDPGIPVLWATWTRSPTIPPFGEVIVIDPYDQ